MYQCELFSILHKKENDAPLYPLQKDINAVLSDKGAAYKVTTDVAADPQKIDDAVSKALLDGEHDLFIFVNALTSTDNSSFRKLFYRTITHLESAVKIDDARKGLTPKLKVSSLGDMGSGYKGYCFSFRGKRFIILPRTALTGRELPELMDAAIDKAEAVFAKNSDKYPEGVAFFDKDKKEADAALNRDLVFDPVTPPQKQGFLRSFIPSKGDTKAQKARKIVVLVAIVAFIGALSYVLEFFIFGPMRNDSVMSDIQKIADNSSNQGEDGEAVSAQNWDALKKVNKEIVGWITIPDTKIDYPVLYHKGDDQNNQYYIKRTYKKNHSEYGSIFVDYRSTDGTNSKNVIMHGHDMIDGSMFGNLLKYSPKGDLKGNLDFYKKHPLITFNTPDGDAKYKIISVFKTSTRYEHGEFFNYMQGEFTSDAEFMNFVYNTRIRSFFDIPVSCNEDDQIITLSTCCYEFYQWRCVVVARKVRPGEDESVDTDLATLNSSPLFPDVYYERYGGTRPDPLTFKTADAKGLVDWYDGKGNLIGSEELTATLAANPTEPPTEKPKKGAPKPTDPPPIVYYSVVYRNDDGTQYAAYTVKEGDPVPTPDGTPTKAEDADYTYEFIGWNKDVDGVDFEHLNVGIDIYPVFLKNPKQ